MYVHHNIRCVFTHHMSCVWVKRKYLSEWNFSPTWVWVIMLLFSIHVFSMGTKATPTSRITYILTFLEISITYFTHVCMFSTYMYAYVFCAALKQILAVWQDLLEMMKIFRHLHLPFYTRRGGLLKTRVTSQTPGYNIYYRQHYRKGKCKSTDMDNLFFYLVLSDWVIDNGYWLLNVRRNWQNECNPNRKVSKHILGKAIMLRAHLIRSTVFL